MRRPRRLHHVGVVSTRRLWFPLHPLGRDRALARLWHHWTPGARAEHAVDGLLLTLPTAVTVDCRTSDAVALLTVDGRFCAAPFRPEDVADVPVGSVVRVVGGVHRATPPQAFEALDPVAWLDLDTFELLDVQPLGPPAPPPAIAVPLQMDPRSRLGIRQPPPHVDEIRTALSEGDGQASGVGGLLRRTLSSLLGSAARGLRRAAAAPPAPVARPARSLANWLRAMSERLGVEALLSRAIGAQHLGYLRRMMQLFDQGDWGEALRHAIPLSEGSRSGATGRRPGWLRPRQTLAPTAASSEAGQSLTMGGGLFGLLEQMYRRAHHALDAQGRVQEAAYVLAELLGEVHEAVAYLERHGELGLAAEMAQTKELDDGLVVLLWLRAGETERALAWARLRRAFAAGVAGLAQRELREHEAALRRAWAEHEAAAGRHAAAAEVLWPLQDQRERAVTWLQHAMSVPGVAGARAWMRHALMHDDRELTLEGLTRLVRAQGVDGSAERAAAADLASAAQLRELGPLLRPLARALVADATRWPSRKTAQRARQVAAACDAALAADLPVLPHTQIRPVEALGQAATKPLEGGVHAADMGTMPVYDAVDLPGGRWLVALGEAGLQIVSHTGQPQHSFLTPAHRLVPDGDRTRVIVVGRRGSLLRLARLDVIAQQLTPWTDAPLGATCDTHDGSLWFVAHADRVMALDVQHDGLRALWSAPDMGRASTGSPAIHSLALHDQRLVVVGRVSATELERFEYRLQNLSLAQRTRHLHAGEPLLVAAPRVWVANHRQLTWLDGSPTQVDEVSSLTADATVAVTTRTLPSGVCVELWVQGLGRVGTLVHEGALRVTCRLTPSLLICTDDRGRLRAIDRSDRSLRADLRI
ncbi:MAG: hypothetical protein KTR31_23560 [Myxococcales bacterium]|nr:hypothetical protein [Myxococcales bacterium]